jgi:glutaredoxin
MKKVRMVRSNARQGIDCCIIEVAIEKKTANLAEQPLNNGQGRKYGTFEVKEGKLIVKLILPLFLRENNIQPFSWKDVGSFSVILSDCKTQIGRVLGKVLDSKVKSAEVNITLVVSGKATQSEVLNLLNHACLTPKRDNVKYVSTSKSCRYKEVANTIIFREPQYYVLKAYDKTKQQKREQVEQKKESETVPYGLLRVEIIMLERVLMKLFGEKRTLSDVFSRKGLLLLLMEYKRIFCDEIRSKRIIPYLKYCVNHLFESLCETDDPISTIAKERELIPDKEVLYRALKKWKEKKGESIHNLRREVNKYTEIYGLPQDTVMTIRDFRKACG